MFILKYALDVLAVSIWALAWWGSRRHMLKARRYIAQAEEVIALDKRTVRRMEELQRFNKRALEVIDLFNRGEHEEAGRKLSELQQLH